MPATGFILGETTEQGFENLNTASKVNLPPENESSYAEARLVRGIVYFQRGNEGDMWLALQAFEKTTEVDPDYAPAYNWLGIAHCTIGEYSEALGNLDRAIELEPDFAWAYSNRAWACIELG